MQNERQTLVKKNTFIYNSSVEKQVTLRKKTKKRRLPHDLEEHNEVRLSVQRRQRKDA